MAQMGDVGVDFATDLIWITMFLVLVDEDYRPLRWSRVDMYCGSHCFE
jgi:hypothetical protein